ncbi:MAG: nitronate monooxygenase [Alphaproteobacteria bacterium]|nr:nitronate monooxygenase [Alphaproteobacteria bacterium]
MKKLNPILISGKEVLPLIEGGKGVAISNGASSGAWAAENAVGTISGVFADIVDETGRIVPKEYPSRVRAERHAQLIRYSIAGAVSQARIAHEIAGNRGRVHMNFLWEMGGSNAIIEGALETLENASHKVRATMDKVIPPLRQNVQEAVGAVQQTLQSRVNQAMPAVEQFLGGAKDFIHGITCGAGMPYRLGEIASKYGIFYYPIVSSARAFKALWLRSYKNFKEFLGGVVYEDPWLAGGHNGLSNSENPAEPQRPYERLVELRRQMAEFGLQRTPIILAGGVWNLSEFDDYIDNPDIGPLAFQFGTRPLLTQESPIAKAWQKTLMALKKGDILLQRFSPTGFYSSAIKNRFLEKLINRSQTEMPYREAADATFTAPFPMGGQTLYLSDADFKRAQDYIAQGFGIPARTPDASLVFLSPEDEKDIRQSRADCIGCLSQCRFSGWSQSTGSTGRLPDPRSFCIARTLGSIAHGGSVDDNLMFAGHAAYRFATDPMYRDDFVPSVRQLIAALLEGK